MGYESRLYFVKDFGFSLEDKKNGVHCSDTIAMLDMSKMGNDPEVAKFRRMFDTETPFSIRVLGYDEKYKETCMVDVIEDCYGDRLKYGDKAKLLRQANRIIKAEEEYCQTHDGWKPYDMFYVMRNMIKAFKDFDDVYIVHFGY